MRHRCFICIVEDPKVLSNQWVHICFVDFTVCPVSTAFDERFCIHSHCCNGYALPTLKKVSIIYWEFLERDQFFAHVLTSLWPKICWIRKFIWICVHRLTQDFQNSVVYVHVLLFDPIVAYYLLDMGLTWPQSGFSLLVITVQILDYETNLQFSRLGHFLATLVSPS